MLGIRTVVTATVAFLMIATPLLANSAGPTLQDKEQHACYDDVMRFCQEFVPDMDATKRCMLTKRKQVSPACLAFYPPAK